MRHRLRGIAVRPAPAGRWIAVFALALALVIAALPGRVAAGVFEPETFTLNNGMRVIVVTNRTAPVVTHMVWYEAGAADEPPGASGVAHYLEHLMFLGTETREEGEFSRIVARNGGEENAFTSWDYTAYFQSVAADRLALVMELEADRMTNLSVSEARALIERDVIVEERRQRVDNDPASRLHEQMYAALFQNHPYGRPIIGWANEMSELTLEDARAFYETWYAPNNAVLVVSGDIDAETLRPLAEEHYGAIPARPVPERTRPQEPGNAAERRVLIADPQVQQADWRRYYLAPSYATAEGSAAAADPYALQVLNEVLGAGTTSRLYEALVLDRQIAVGAGSSYSPSNLDDSVFGLFVTPRPGVDIREIEAAVDDTIAGLIEDGVGEEEVAAARERLAIEAIYARDSLFRPARTVGRAVTIDYPLAELEQWPERIRAVTAEEVVAAAGAVLQRAQSVTGVLTPAEPPEMAQTGPADEQPLVDAPRDGEVPVDGEPADEQAPGRADEEIVR
jgi:zinc protease